MKKIILKHWKNILVLLLVTIASVGSLFINDALNLYVGKVYYTVGSRGGSIAEQSYPQYMKQIGKIGSTGLAVTAKTNTGFEFFGWSDGTKEEKHETVFKRGKVNISAHWKPVNFECRSLFLDNQNNNVTIGKETTYNIKNEEFILKEQTTYTNSRFGGKKDYILESNDSRYYLFSDLVDQTKLRNYVSYLALGYETSKINLYIDGKYSGIYTIIKDNNFINFTKYPSFEICGSLIDHDGDAFKKNGVYIQKLNKVSINTVNDLIDNLSENKLNDLTKTSFLNYFLKSYLFSSTSCSIDTIKIHIINDSLYIHPFMDFSLGIDNCKYYSSSDVGITVTNCEIYDFFSDEFKQELNNTIKENWKTTYNNYVELIKRKSSEYLQDINLNSSVWKITRYHCCPQYNCVTYEDFLNQYINASKTFENHLDTLFK